MAVDPCVQLPRGASRASAVPVSAGRPRARAHARCVPHDPPARMSDAAKRATGNRAVRTIRAWGRMGVAGAGAAHASAARASASRPRASSARARGRRPGAQRPPSSPLRPRPPRMPGARARFWGTVLVLSMGARQPAAGAASMRTARRTGQPDSLLQPPWRQRGGIQHPQRPCRLAMQVLEALALACRARSPSPRPAAHTSPTQRHSSADTAAAPGRAFASPRRARTASAPPCPAPASASPAARSARASATASRSAASCASASQQPRPASSCTPRSGAPACCPWSGVGTLTLTY